jgi:hypothetical protein
VRTFVRLLAPIVAALALAPALAHAEAPPVQRPRALTEDAGAPDAPDRAASSHAGASVPATGSTTPPPAPAAATGSPVASRSIPPSSELDLERHRRRAAAGGTVLVLGIGAGVTAAVLADLSLAPRCGDEADVMTCEIPDGADIRRRAGMLGAGAAVSIAGAVMAGLGTRALVRNTALDASLARHTRRRQALAAAGATTIVIGTAGLVTGSVVAGLGIKRTTADTQAEIDPTDIAGTEQAVKDDVTGRLDGLRVARTGLALALASPTILAIGVALVRNRDQPRRERTVRITPNLSPRNLGATLHARF